MDNQDSDSKLEAAADVMAMAAFGLGMISLFLGVAPVIVVVVSGSITLSAVVLGSWNVD